MHLGAEAKRTHGYRDDERVTHEMLADFDMSQLICEHSRMVTDRGVHVCPILIDSPDSWLGHTSERIARRIRPTRRGLLYLLPVRRDLFQSGQYPRTPAQA